MLEIHLNIHNGIESTFSSDILRGSLMVLPIIFTSYLVGGLCEVGFAIIRKHEINEGFLVSGMLFPLTLAPTTPLWQVALGIAFGIIIGKEIFGGVGYNILNPALTGRAFLFFAYPAQISGDTVWVGSLKDTPIVNKILGIAEPSAGWQALDGVTMATPLAVSGTAENGINAVNSLSMSGFNLAGMVIGNISGSIGSTSVIAILLGLGFLLLTGVASNKIIFSGIAELMGLLFNILPTDNSFANILFYYHLAMGGFMFGIVFMATDPVSWSSKELIKVKLFMDS